MPTPVTVGDRVKHLVQKAVAAVERQHVAVSARIGIPLDGRAGRNRHRPGIALIAVGGEIDVYQPLRAVHYDIVNSHTRTVVEAGNEIRMDTNICTDEVDDGA